MSSMELGSDELTRRPRSTMESLPHELLHYIAYRMDPADLGALCRTSKALRNVINGNALLWKQVYLKHFANPRPGCKMQEFPWEREMHKAVKLEKLLESRSEDQKSDNLQFIVDTISSLLSVPEAGQTKSLNSQFIKKHFTKEEEDSINFDCLMCCSSIFDMASAKSEPTYKTAEERQLSAKLHCLWGDPVDPRSWTPERPLHMYARAQVYDLRNYTTANGWGPFLERKGEFAVDWEKLECIITVLRYNLDVFNERTDNRSPAPKPKPFVDVLPDSYVPCMAYPASDPKAQPIPPLVAQDPYNVTGDWLRVVCFLDYAELFSYNFGPDAEAVPDGQPRYPTDREEAIRLIAVKLRITNITEANPAEDSMALPKVEFVGRSRSLHAGWDPNANSMITGCVRLTKEGQVRWTTFSVFHGEERWRSEGIQIGGRNSGRGVWGTWFEKDYDREGPAGPTAFWKMGDKIPEEKVEQIRFS